MIFKVKVIANSKQEKIEEIGESELKIHLTEKPEKGKANKALIEFLADHFDINTSDVRILSGHLSNDKLVEIAA